MQNSDKILDNPFHPLDLTPQDLLTIYKRFQQSIQINRNPYQQLPIEVIAQLISSLKGCPPSYIQKCMSEALIKETISWRIFLRFLDQESEVRENILQWLMYEKNTIKYKEDKNLNVRSIVKKFYEEITFLKFIEMGANESYLILCIDNVQFYLLSFEDDKIELIDEYQNRSERAELVSKHHEKKDDKEFLQQKATQFKTHMKNQSKTKKMMKASSLIKSVKNEREKAVSFITQSTKLMQSSNVYKEDEQLFYKKQRKNINSLFGIFKNLPMKQCIHFSKAISNRLDQKTINTNMVKSLKEVLMNDTAHQTPIQISHKEFSATQNSKSKVQNYLSSLYKQKKTLSYNPYNKPKSQSTKSTLGDIIKLKKPLATKQRKDREYTFESSHIIYNDKLKCLAIGFYNFEITIVKISRQYNKVCFEELDKIKIQTQNQHKKNQVIQWIQFYQHVITNKWLLLVLMRVQYKNQNRNNNNQSYIRCYQLEKINKRGGQSTYRIKKDKELFKLNLGKFQIFKMKTHFETGMHFISIDGNYFHYKQCFEAPSLYFTFEHSQNFKNTKVSLTTLHIFQSINKIVFGTLRGLLIIYDMFSHQFKSRKIGNGQIVQIKGMDQIAYVLLSNQKAIVYDLVKCEEIQQFSVRNEQKLHEKMRRFELFKGCLYFYGTECKRYKQFVDQKLMHEQRKMQTMYKWRLDKLANSNTLVKDKNTKIKGALRVLQKIEVQKNIQNDKQSAKTIQLILTSPNYFLALSQILELIVVSRKELKIRSTIILNIPHDSKVLKISLCPNQKLLALLLLSQQIYIFNIHTQDLFKHLKPTFFRYSSLCFLDTKNQYLLAAGTDNGKIPLINYYTIQQKNMKVLSLHRKNVGLMIKHKNQFLVCGGEQGTVSVWALPFNSLKHQIKMKNQDFLVDHIGCHKDLEFFRTVNGNILQINLINAKIVIYSNFSLWKDFIIDSCTFQLIGLNKKNELVVMEKEKDHWKEIQIIKDLQKQEIKYLGVVDSEKIVVFYENGWMVPWSYQAMKFGKIIKLSCD